MNAAASILVLLAPNPSPLTGRGTNTYVVGEDEVVVIDPGPADADHLHRLLGAVAERGKPAAVVITHHHFDHSEAASEVAERLGAPLAGFPHPDSPVLHRELADGDEISFGGGVLRALHTPGHASDHLCFWLPEAATVFAGDLVAGEGYIVIDPPDGDMAQYMDSLRRLRDIGAATIRPGHGPLIDAPDAYVEAYLAHRLEREATVLRSLGSEPRTVGQLLPVAYDDTPKAMFSVAARSLTAHLEKLAREGKVEVVTTIGESAYKLAD
jgi:glyoxylase-like metal-dependent hydrolase (beta-lactamase superfamily II)